MGYRLDHVAILCKNLQDSVGYYEKIFGGKATPLRKGAAGYGFCFIHIEGRPAVQLMESADKTGVHHYGFIADDVESAARELKERGAKIVRENRDAAGNLTTIFLEEPNGLQIEVRAPR